MLIHNTTTERGVSLVNCCNKSKASLVSKDKCMRVQWEGDQKRSREHPEDAASGGTAPAGPGPQDGWMEGLCWQGGKTKGRRRRRGSHTFSREAESIVQKLIKPKHLQQPSNSRMCPCVCVCVCLCEVDAHVSVEPGVHVCGSLVEKRGMFAGDGWELWGRLRSTIVH